ncbi:hypothetical protein ACL02U_25225 [Streptomyces sp. MS06]|uniref:hypothetical protein n=1 Tax=Streptomyces sp. MS06 TaxID=3385974 RepID=UPI00399F6978
MERRLEAGWFQRTAWSALVWGSLGLLVWVPFLYVAIRRGRPSDWGAFASFVLYELVTVPLAISTSDGSGSPLLGLAVILTLLIATAMLLFAVFDRKTARTAYPAGPPAAPPAPGYGYPYGR